jgi:hypothetical protein
MSTRDDSFQIPPAMLRLFGTPRMANPASQRVYNLARVSFAEDVEPRDRIEWIFVNDLADHFCEVKWLRDVRAYLSNAPYYQFLAQRRSSRAGRVKELTDRTNAEWSNIVKEYESDPEKLKSKRAEMQLSLDAEIERIERETSLEVEDSALNFSGVLIDRHCYEWVEQRLTVAEQRFAKCLRMLDDYRGGLGARLRQTSDDIIEGEFQEEKPPNNSSPAADVSSMSRPPGKLCDWSKRPCRRPLLLTR